MIPDGGPKPTSFTYFGNENYFKKGNTTEGPGHTTEDPIFEMKIKYFDGKAEFKQRIKVKGQIPFKVKGSVEFMVCDDTRCLPPTDVDLVLVVIKSFEMFNVFDFRNMNVLKLF